MSDSLARRAPGRRFGLPELRFSRATPGKSAGSNLSGTIGGKRGASWQNWSMICYAAADSSVGSGFRVVRAFCVRPREAQVRGVPTSVTSIGFGGHFGQAPGIPPSVTSLGPLGYSGRRPSVAASRTSSPTIRMLPCSPTVTAAAPLFPLAGDVYAVPYPVYAVDPAADDSAEENDYPSGPTIFDAVLRANRARPQKPLTPSICGPSSPAIRIPSPRRASSRQTRLRSRSTPDGAGIQRRPPA